MRSPLRQDHDNDLLDLFMHPGWKHLMEEIQQAHDILLQTCWQVSSTEELFRRKGQIQQASFMLNYEELTKARIDEDLRAEDPENEHEAL